VKSFNFSIPLEDPDVLLDNPRNSRVFQGKKDGKIQKNPFEAKKSNLDEIVPYFVRQFSELSS
jgi:hypothetical protein